MLSLGGIVVSRSLRVGGYEMDEAIAQQTGEPRPGVGAMTSTRRCTATAASTPVR